MEPQAQYIQTSRYAVIAVAHRDWGVVDHEVGRLICTCPKQSDARHIAHAMNVQHDSENTITVQNWPVSVH